MRTHKMIAVAALIAAGAAHAADPGGVKIDGEVMHPQVFTLADVKTLPPVQVDVSVTTMHGQDHHAWTGALLLTLVNKAGLKNAPGKNSWLRHAFLVHGADGYVAALSIGEIDPMAENKQVILAYRKSGDTVDLPALRLVVPGDSHAPRQVHEVVEIEVK